MRSHRIHPAFWTLLSLLVTGGAPSHAQQTAAPFDSTWLGFNTQTLVGTQPYFLSSARLVDVDNDGRPDVVTSKFGSDIGISRGFIVLKNNGGGVFDATPVHYPSSLASKALEVADLNGDGWKDVVLSNTGSNNQGNTIAVYLNLGGGVFGNPSTHTVGQGPTGIAAADLNGDGIVDLAVTNYNGGFGSTVSVLFGSGGGSFLPAVAYPAGDAPNAVVAARINGDGFPDLVVANGWANGGASINVLTNSGTGAFTNRTEYSTSGRAYTPAVAVADMDNDGDNDIVFPYFDFNSGAIVNLYRNNGNGTLSVVPIQMDPYTVIADVGTADLNGDGWRDIVGTSASARTTDGYEVAMNNGHGAFSYAYHNPAGQSTAVVMLGDANGDGRTDILTADAYSMEITVHKNFGSGSFPLPRLSDLGAAMTEGSVDAADVDGDGRPDVVVSASGRAAVDAPVKVLRNLGGGSFGPPVPYGSGGGLQAKLRDLNGDGRPDLLYASGIQTTPYDFFYAMNLGNGTFGPVQRKPIGACGWYDVDAFDLNNDGLPDVVLTEAYGCQNIPLSARRIFICRNLGNGAFAEPIIKVVGPHPMPLAAGDFDRDGNLDLVTGVSGGVIEVYYGLGNCDVSPPFTYPIGAMGGAEDIVVADFNSDGKLDIASDNYLDFGTYTMSVLYGNGDRTFQPALVLPSPQSPDLANVSGITAGDFDGDGDKDIMVANYASHTLSLYRNDGTTFRYLPERIGVYWGIYSPFFADFDEDGYGDIVALGEMPPSGLFSTLVFLKGTNPATSDVATNDLPGPGTRRLGQNFPNPFRRSTIIPYTIATPGTVTLDVFDLRGRKVARLVDGEVDAGAHTATWESRDLASGVYYYRLTAPGARETRRMMLLK